MSQAASIAPLRSCGPRTKTTSQLAILLDRVNKWYGAMHVLRDVSLSVGQKERVVVCV